jgi:hypothetical protein
MTNHVQAVELTTFRLFCVVFVVSFALFMASLAASEWAILDVPLPDAPSHAQHRERVTIAGPAPHLSCRDTVRMRCT